MNIDEAAQKIAEILNEVQGAGFEVDWDRCDGGLWITRSVPHPEGTVGRTLGSYRLESRHVREVPGGSSWELPTVLWAVSE